MKCAKGRRSDKIREAVNLIVDEGGLPFQSLDAIATIVQQKVIEINGFNIFRRHHINGRTMATILREFKVDRKKVTIPNENPIRVTRILGREAYKEIEKNVC